MTTQALRGTIEPLALVDVLAYLGRNRESGVLNVVRGAVEKSIVIDNGQIVFARSNQYEDRLGDILLARGIINQDQYDQGTELLKKKGFRHGRALVEIGAISPKTLWETIQEQIEIIACSVIPWETGTFEFLKKTIRQKESITVRKPILDLILDVIRNLDNRALFRARFPNPSLIFRKTNAPVPEELTLEPHETYLLNFIDGQANLAHICSKSDFGRDESLRVIYLLRALGLVESQPAAEPNAETMAKLKIHPLIEKYNRMFQFVHQYLADRVGPVGTNMLRKYFSDTITSHNNIFHDVRLLKDGGLDTRKVQENMDTFGKDHSEGQATMAMDDALNEFLMMGVLAVKKVLGTEHESAVVQHISSMT